jgi:hypothetical protein
MHTKTLLLGVLSLTLAIVGCGKDSSSRTGPSLGEPAQDNLRPTTYCSTATQELVRGALPAGWRMIVAGNQLALHPPKPVRLANMISVESGTKPEDHVVAQDYLILLRFGPLVNQDERTSMLRGNAAVQAEIDAAYHEMRRRGIVIKWTCFPKTAEDRTLVAEYERLKASLQQPPDVHGQDFSVWIADTLGNLTFVSAEDEAACTSLLAMVRKLFESY